MSIDWFTVVAQALNFVILAWLLKRYLFKPILHAVDAREKRIAAELADADSKKAEAQKARDEFLTKREAFEKERAALLNQAKDEANVERQRLLDEARQAADALSVKRRESLTSETLALSQALTSLAQTEVFAIARKTLMDLASVNLEERICEVFTRSLRTMNSDAKAVLVAALETTSDPVIVRSAFELPEAQRTSIQNALNETLSTQIRIRFEAAPEIVSGVELACNGQKVAWSIAEYLASLKKNVDNLLQDLHEPTEPEAKANLDPEPGTMDTTNPCVRSQKA